MSDSIPGLDAGREALRRFLVGDDTLTTMLTKVARIATEIVPGVDFASITMVRDGTPTTPVFTDDVALALDETQYELGDGPCLAAIRHRGVETFAATSDDRWPAFAAAAQDAAVIGVLSAALVNEEVAVGGLNMYSKTTETFDQAARETASLFADQLGVAAAKAAEYAESYQLAEQLQQALEFRAAIEQAKGILMAQSRIGPDEAFGILVRASQHQNRKLRAIAAEIVERYTRGNERYTGRTTG
jgi:GAF domain-containing protein